MSDTNYAQIKVTVTHIGVSLQDMTGGDVAAENQDKCCIWRKCWNNRYFAAKSRKQEMCQYTSKELFLKQHDHIWQN